MSPVLNVRNAGGARDPERKAPTVASIDEVLTSISANVDAVNELQGQIEASKAQVDEVLGQLQSLGIEAAANALNVGKEQLEESSAMAAALVTKLEEARNSAEAAKHS